VAKSLVAKQLIPIDRIAADRPFYSGTRAGRDKRRRASRARRFAEVGSAAVSTAAIRGLLAATVPGMK
jgi:hypothetical protein